MGPGEGRMEGGGDLQLSKYLCMETGWVLKIHIWGGIFLR